MTSFITSPSPEISSLRFEPLPSRNVLDVKAMRIGDTTVIALGGGRVYSSSMRGNFMYPEYWDLDNTLDGCVRLGLISKEAFALHKKCSEDRRAQRDRKYHVASIEASAKVLGVKFTKAQVCVLERAKKGAA